MSISTCKAHENITRNADGEEGGVLNVNFPVGGKFSFAVTVNIKRRIGDRLGSLQACGRWESERVGRGSPSNGY